MRPSAKNIFKRLMILKYLISHSFRNMPAQALIEAGNNWSENEKEDFQKELEKSMNETVTSIKDFNLWKHVTETEKEFLTSYGTGIDEVSQMNVSWRIEAVIVLMWALQKVDNFPKIDEQTNPEVLKGVEIKKLKLFSNDLTFRNFGEISRMRDIIETWHWRVNTRRLIEDNYNFEPDPSMKESGINSLDDIVRLTAKSAFESGEIAEIKDEDFVYKGTPFRDLSQEDFQEAKSIIIERHYGLNWICGYAPKNNWDETPTDT